MVLKLLLFENHGDAKHPKRVLLPGKPARCQKLRSFTDCDIAMIIVSYVFISAL